MRFVFASTLLVAVLVSSRSGMAAQVFIDAKAGSGDSDLEREVNAMLKHYGGYRKVDGGWRAYAKNNFRIVR